MKTLVLCAVVFCLGFQVVHAQLTLNPSKKSPESSSPTTSETTSQTKPATDVVIYEEVIEDKPISYNFPVSPKIWGIGAGLSLNTIMSPKALDSATDAGAGFQAWGRYQFNQHLGSQFGLYQHDFTDSSFGITALKYSFLFQTGWPDGFFPFLGIGASLNNVNKSQVYSKDYTQLGWQMSLGAHIPSQKLGKRTFFIPQVEFYQVFEKNNDAKAITGLAFLISLGYFFDAEDFTKNVSLINGK
jgi:hypothetical protein